MVYISTVLKAPTTNKVNWLEFRVRFSPVLQLACGFDHVDQLLARRGHIWYDMYDVLYLVCLCGGAQGEKGLRTQQRTPDPKYMHLNALDKEQRFESTLVRPFYMLFLGSKMGPFARAVCGFVFLTSLYECRI